MVKHNAYKQVAPNFAYFFYQVWRKENSAYPFIAAYLCIRDLRVLLEECCMYSSEANTSHIFDVKNDRSETYDTLQINLI